MGVTVRALQYYDRQGLLSPSAESAGGRRLYADKDLIRLHQILSLKHLGFSLDDIKNRLSSLNTPADVAQALSEQVAAVQEKIEVLSESAGDRALKAEVLQMQSVNFKKYADIIVNLQMNNTFYWLIKHFDDRTLDHIRSRFDQTSGLKMIETFHNLQSEAIRLQGDGVSPESEKGQAFAEAFWQMVTEFTGGDREILSLLMEVGKFDGLDNEMEAKTNRRQCVYRTSLEAFTLTIGCQFI